VTFIVKKKSEIQIFTTNSTTPFTIPPTAKNKCANIIFEMSFSRYANPSLSLKHDIYFHRVLLFSTRNITKTKIFSPLFDLSPSNHPNIGGSDHLVPALTAFLMYNQKNAIESTIFIWPLCDFTNKPWHFPMSFLFIINYSVCRRKFDIWRVRS